jgi:hypothetical protein
VLGNGLGVGVSGLLSEQGMTKKEGEDHRGEEFLCA